MTGLGIGGFTVHNHMTGLGIGGFTVYSMYI